MRIIVTPWEDPVVDRHGFAVHSDYVEHWWLPVIGPTSLLCLRRLASAFIGTDDPRCEVDVAELAWALGLGKGIGPNSPMQRTIKRLCRFNLARPTHNGDGPGLAVRLFVDAVALPMRKGWSPHMEAEHERAVFAARGIEIVGGR